MNKYISYWLVCGLFVLASCHTTKKTSYSRSKQPVFIDDIYLGSHNRNSATNYGVDRNVRPPDKKYATRKPFSKKAIDAEPNASDDGKPKVCLPKNMPKELAEKYASILGVSRKEVSNYELYSFIDEWYGTAYHIGGLDKNGIDCSGFAKRLYEAVFGMELAHSSMEQYATSKHLKKGIEYDEGDLVFFRTHGKRISHVGVYLMNDFFVHASTSQGVVISNLKEEYWQKHFAGAGKMRE